MSCSSDWWQSPALSDFLCEGGVKLGSVDTSNDKRVLGRTWNFSIPQENYEDIQDLYYDVYKIKKAGMATMAAKIIDPWYEDMKKRMHWTGHHKWDKKKLDRVNIIYAAIDVFVALQLYRVLKPMSDAIKMSKKTRKGGDGSSSCTKSSDGSSSCSESSDESPRANKRRRRA